MGWSGVYCLSGVPVSTSVHPHTLETSHFTFRLVVDIHSPIPLAGRAQRVLTGQNCDFQDTGSFWESKTVYSCQPVGLPHPLSRRSDRSFVKSAIGRLGSLHRIPTKTGLELGRVEVPGSFITLTRLQWTLYLCSGLTFFDNRTLVERSGVSCWDLSRAVG